ncbi:MAG TPA: TolC family protein [Verrucomicrobiae bacterium]|nr:TolC family protein [Verrucomicrobiae bacterium]
MVAVTSFETGFKAFGADNAPPSPDKPWRPPHLDEYEDALAHGHFKNERRDVTVEIDSNKVYDLPELIDIAERTNPETRTAWERARQAAEAVGLARSAYYPYLAASAGAGYERAFMPFPELSQGPDPGEVSVKGGHTLVTEAVGERATLGLKWLLFDFGERKAEAAIAKEKLMAASVGFNAVHQQIVFTVTQRFYELNTARQKVAVAESSLRAADTVAQAARARLDNGLATKPEVLQAEQQSAQAGFDLEAANGAFSDAQVALVESLGILPTHDLEVADVPDKPYPENPAESLDDLLDRALSQRPDLVAKLADLRAGQAGVRKARAAYYPKISLDANAGWAQLDVSVKNSSYFGDNEPVYGGGLSISLPIFDGFARRKKLQTAESELRAAEDELDHSRDSAIREVWKYRTDFETSLRKQESAQSLVSAAESAFAASLDAYQHGLGTYVDVANAQRNVTASRSVMIDTRAAIYTSAAVLALSVGDLARPSPTAKSLH